jgi:vitamin B12 transporter
VPTARLGLRRELSGGWFGRAAGYAGFRPPTLNELHRPFRVGNDVTEANSALKPERLYGVETGLGWQQGAASVQAGVFYNRLEDAIANVTIGVGPATFPVAGLIPAGGVLRQRQNTGTVKAYGVESEARWAVMDTVTVNLAAAYTHAEVDGGTAAPQLTGMRPAQTPRVSAMASVDWKVIEPLSLRADLRYEGMRFDDDLNSRRLADATTVDVSLEWRVAGPLSVVAAAENLFDVNLTTAVTGDGVRSFGPPRRFRVGLVLGR